MRQQIRQRTVVGDEDQAFARKVQPADHEQPLGVGHQIEDARAAGWIAGGGDDACRLVEHVIQAARGAGDRLAVDANVGELRIDFGSQRRDDRPIDGHSAGRNQLLAFAPAADAGVGQNFLQPEQFARRFIVSGSLPRGRGFRALRQTSMLQSRRHW